MPLGVGNPPFANGGFPTPSGKAELYSEALAANGLDPVASFVPPVESRHSVGDLTRSSITRKRGVTDENGGAPRYPLELLSRKHDNFLNSTFHNVASLQAMEQRGLLEICAEDARSRGITEGDSVRVFNSRGEIVLKARVASTVRPGVVATHLNWAKLTGGTSVNVLTSQRRTDLGGGPTFYSTLVEVAKL